jgi:hypothetical protein
MACKDTVSFYPTGGTPRSLHIFFARDGAFYFLSTLSGFVAWYLALKKDSIPITALAALAIFTVLGISGALQRILYLGKKPI